MTASAPFALRYVNVAQLKNMIGDPTLANARERSDLVKVLAA
jgi:hypothetical protein